MYEVSSKKTKYKLPIIKGVERPSEYNYESNDCTVRSLSNATDISYETAHQLLKDAGRNDNKGFHFYDTITYPGCVKGYSIVEMEQVLHQYYQKGPKITLRKFLTKHKCGTYILVRRGHALVIKDGLIIDRTPNRPNQWILRAFKVTNN